MTLKYGVQNGRWKLMLGAVFKMNNKRVDPVDIVKIYNAGKD